VANLKVVIALISCLVAAIAGAVEFIIAVRQRAGNYDYLATATNLLPIAVQPVVRVIGIVGRKHAKIGHVTRVIGARIPVIALQIRLALDCHVGGVSEITGDVQYSRVEWMPIQHPCAGGINARDESDRSESRRSR
jgi:hypothetical protein